MRDITTQDGEQFECSHASDFTQTHIVGSTNPPNVVDSIPVTCQQSDPQLGTIVEHTTNNGLGMTLIFLSTMCFAVGNALVSIIGLQIPVMQIIFIRGSSQLVLALIFIAATSGPRKYCTATWLGAPKHRMLLLSRAIWGVAALITLFAAFQVVSSTVMDSLYCINHFRFASSVCPWPTQQPSTTSTSHSQLPLPVWSSKSPTGEDVKTA